MSIAVYVMTTRLIADPWLRVCICRCADWRSDAELDTVQAGRRQHVGTDKDG